MYRHKCLFIGGIIVKVKLFVFISVVTSLFLLTSCTQSESKSKNDDVKIVEVTNQTKQNVPELTPKKEEVKKEEVEYLSDLEYEKRDGAIKNDGLSFNKAYFDTKLQINGHPYNKGISVVSYPKDESTLQYNLNGNFSKLVALVGIDDYSPAGGQKASGEIIIYGDDKELYSSGILKYDLPAKDVELNLKGVKQIKIMFKGDKTNMQQMNTDINLVEPKLIK
jgi:hypothetical protein